MALRDDVEEYIKHGHPRELPQLLQACLRDGSLDALVCVTRMFEDMYGGITYNFELKAPPAWELACWGKLGVDQLVDATLKSPTSKNVSLCLQILSQLASGNRFIERPIFCDEAHRARLHGLIEREPEPEPEPELALYAQRKLLSIVLAVEEEDDLLSMMGAALSQASFAPTGGLGPAKELFAALSARWLSISEPLIRRYETLIADHPDDEPAFQSFFTEHPQVLDPLAAEIWTQPSLHGAQKPDFVIRRFDNSYIAVEIETPAKQLVTLDNQTSAYVTHAVAQVTEYRRFLERLPAAQTNFPNLDQVTCLAVVGLEAGLTPPQERTLRNYNREHYGLQLVGFDWLARRGRAMRENIVRTGVAIRQHTHVA
jgi:hypothetical protein